MRQVTENYSERDFWIGENRQYAEGNFRLRKCARLLNEIAAGRLRDLLDVGCGPAALRMLIDANIRYHGIDIALHETAPYLRETDFVRNPIAYDGRRFDLVVALGVFEYMGKQQDQKLAEISRLLKPGGTFIMSYINFSHVRRRVYPIYNNIQPIGDMLNSLERRFRVESCYPVSHHWRHKQPGRNALRPLQMRMKWSIPGLSSWFAVEYFCVCSARS